MSFIAIAISKYNACRRSQYLKMCMQILADFLKADEYLIFVKPYLLKVNNWDYSYI